MGVKAWSDANLPKEHEYLAGVEECVKYWLADGGLVKGIGYIIAHGKILGTIRYRNDYRPFTELHLH
jgi:hypothetical protein